MSRSRAAAALCTAGILLGVMASFGAGGAAANGPVASSHAAAPTCGGDRPTKPGGGRYTCTFTDDFTATTLDTSKWTVGTTAQGGFTTGTMLFGARDCYVDSRRNVSVTGGQLHLTSRVEPIPAMCQSPYGPFRNSKTAGSVLSKGKFTQTYGRFEFRARFPQTTLPYVDSALWLYPQDLTYGSWPRSGEIDVAEWFGSGHTDHVSPSLHYAREIRSQSTGQDCVVPKADSGFHTYAVDWTRTKMYFYYDKKLCFQHAWKSVQPVLAPLMPFDKPFGVVMTQTGGQHAPIGTKTTMDVDWVRAWK